MPAERGDPAVTIDPILALRLALVLSVLGVAVVAIVITLAVDRYKRAEDRATIAETLLAHYQKEKP